MSVDLSRARDDGSALPAGLTTFVGRERELDAIRERFTTTRLLTLTGPGGVGKTRLALRFAADASDGFADGAWFIPLGAVDDASLVAEEIVHRLGLAEAGEGTALERLREYIADRELLLVLDNFEHVLDGALLLPEILASGAGIKLLVTSRAALRLSAEHVFPVDVIAGPQAVELFAQRAAAVDPGSSLRPPWRRWWRTSARIWMGCRWRSSWRRRGSGCCRPQ